MPKPLELRKVAKILKRYGIIYMAGRGRHPKCFTAEKVDFYPACLAHLVKFLPR